MKTLKKLHRQTELHIKLGLPVVVFIILPSALVLYHAVFTTRNIIF